MSSSNTSRESTAWVTCFRPLLLWSRITFVALRPFLWSRTTCVVVSFVFGLLWSLLWSRTDVHIVCSSCRHDWEQLWFANQQRLVEQRKQLADPRMPQIGRSAAPTSKTTPSPGYYSFTSRISGRNTTVSRLGNGCLVVCVVSSSRDTPVVASLPFSCSDLLSANSSSTHDSPDCAWRFLTGPTPTANNKGPT